MKEKFLKICTDNTIKVVELENNIRAFYKELRCTHIEIVWPRYLRRPYIMICDEEFMLKNNVRINPVASYMYGTHEHGNPIKGDVLIANQNGEYTLGLDEKDIENVGDIVQSILKRSNQ